MIHPSLDFLSPTVHSNIMHTTTALMDTTHFNSFDFSDPSLGNHGSMVYHGDTEHTDVFSTSQPHPAAFLPAQPPAAPGLSPNSKHDGLGAAQRKPSLVGSGDDSPNSGHGDAHSFEDGGADEFGLSSHGLADGTDLGGKTKDEKMDMAPAWSELKTKAGKERKRLPLACIACRRKKIRCSGEKPACKHCLRSRIPCVYKVTTRKAAPRTDYMAMLDKRLKRMEERIIKIVPGKEQPGSSPNITRAVLKPSIPGTGSVSSKTGSKKRPAEEAFGPDLENWANGPVKSKLDGVDKPTSLQIQEAEENKLFLAGLDALPSKEIQEHLAEVFFENIYGQAYHLLHKPSYMRKLKAGTLPPVLILSVCAIAARFSTHPKLNSSPNFLRGEEWASHAREICTTRYEWPNITILTCLLILGLHEFGTCHGGRSWALGGQAIRMAFALQLHKDLEYDPLGQKGASQLSFIDREIRRRTMWACFLMDRFNSSGTDRPMFIKEDTVKIPLPIKEKYFQLDMPGVTETLAGNPSRTPTPEDSYMPDAKDNIGVAAYMVRSISLWGKIIGYLNQEGKDKDQHPIWSTESEFTKLTKDAEDLLETLPDLLKYNQDNIQLHETENMANQFLFLHISIQQNILFLNRVAVAFPGGSVTQNTPKAFVSAAGAKTFSAANRISEILKDAEPYVVAAPFVGYCAFSAATIHIIGIFSGTPSVEATSKKHLTTNVKFLTKMKRYWGMFHWMAENLRGQYRSCADAARHGGPSKEGATSPIFQYGDWFDRYPHGVSQTDFEDPASVKKKEKGEDAVLEQKPELHTVEEFFTTLPSPHSTESNKDSSKPPAHKRKAAAGRKQSGSSVSTSKAEQQQHQLDPILTDFSEAAVPRSSGSGHSAHGRTMSGQLGPQTSGPGDFNPLAVPSSQSNAYHGLSPISPVAMSQYGHQHGLGPGDTNFYSTDLMSMSLNQQVNGMLQPLDRQLVFGAYAGMDQGEFAPQGMMDNVSDWDNMSAGTARTPSVGQRIRRPSTQQGRMNSLGGMQRHAQHQQAQQQPFATFGSMGGQEASSAWFMPFNMEPPELGQDMGLNLDNFTGIFGGAMGTPGGMGARHPGGQ
ncbi:hypothetical protein BN1723_005156 [Verticillium longisporum]|uniref:Zn(2)-C6 fungal-type domain-containing protein n=1 Tax=Verticillium longisporum TaxID=100787 RepID=A0A0G4N4T6_VERLO|nr:hypothetical protein BN1723_005156 [Verticillium longisporum]